MVLSLYTWKNKILKTIDGLVNNERCCCCRCCGFNGDEYPVGCSNGAGDHPTHGPAFATYGDLSLYISGYTIQLDGPCKVSWDLDIVITDALNPGSECSTTGTLTLYDDCCVCDNLFWIFQIEQCVESGFTVPSDFIGGEGCLLADCNDTPCGDCTSSDSLEWGTGCFTIVDPDCSSRNSQGVCRQNGSSNGVL